VSRLLIVDDNIEWLSMLEELFLSEGYQVDAVKNGMDALKAAEKHSPDLIFTDLLMPEMDGFTLCQKLKSRAELNDVPVIFCSGYFDEKDQKTLENALGVSQFIHKPARMDDILQRVRSMLSAETSQKHALSTQSHDALVHPGLQEIYKTTMLEKLTGMVDMLHDERQTYKDLLLRFNSLTDSAADPISIVDAKGKICYWNRAAESCFQYLADEVIGKPVSMIAPESLHLSGEGAFFAFLESDAAKKIGNLLQFVACRKDGSLFPVDVSRSSWQEKGEAYQGLIIRDVTERNRLESQLLTNLESFILAVARLVEARDPYTAGHQRRVSGLAVAIAKQLGLDEKTIQGIHYGAMVHDIGKISIPAEILARPSRLLAPEYDIIKCHTSVGFSILADIDFPWPIAQMAHQHHERMNGSGYPQGLKGDEILLESRIIAVADVVEAISSHRPYRPALGHEAAIREISENRGSLYDPAVVDACLLAAADFNFD